MRTRTTTIARALSVAALVFLVPARGAVTPPAPATAAPAPTTCGPYTMRGLLSGRTSVVAVQSHGGDIDCTEASEVMYRYLSDRTLERHGSGGFAFFDGWRCATVAFGSVDDLGYNAGCTHESRRFDIRAVVYRD